MTSKAHLSITDPSRCYIIAEMSANHQGSLQTAREIIYAAKEAGADAVKLQTYTADTLTIDCDRADFLIGKGTIWEGRKLHELYEEAFTPWEWHAELFELAKELKLDCFSSPFDNSSVDFLEQFNPPAYKIASFEMIDLPLIEYVASKGRPIIMSTGMATLDEISEAVEVVIDANVSLTLLKCTSAYPAPPDSMNLATIQHLATTFSVPCGLSDHTMGIEIPVAAVALGAKVIEKHFTLSRDVPGPDSAFSLEPKEFKAMVEAVRNVEMAIGSVSYAQTEKESASRAFRRSLYVVEDIGAGEQFTSTNVRSIRPGFGLAPKHLSKILNRKAAVDLARGTALNWDYISEANSDN